MRHKVLFQIASIFLLSACAIAVVRAQDSPPGGPRQRPTPTPAPTSSNRGNTRGIYGAIRWKKEYGLPSTDDGQTPNKSVNCGAFRVEATVRDEAGGAFGQPRAVGYYIIQNEPTEDNGYFICRYSFTDQNPLPDNRVIRVSALLGSFDNEAINHALTSGGWSGPDRPRPPAGFQRVVIGGRGVTLTPERSTATGMTLAVTRATVDFEMVYRPLPATPR